MSAADATIAARAQQIFDERYDALARRTDRLFGGLMAGQWLFGIVLALTLSPYTWAGKTRALHFHLTVAVFVGMLVSALPLVLVLRRPGETITRMTIAAAQMLWSALLIHLSGGRIETHFHVFGSLAFLAFYRDWRVFVPATLVVTVDHLARQLLWPESVYGIVAPEAWRFLEHAFWVFFEEAFLVASCIVAMREMRTLAMHHARLELQDQMQRELEIATRIQTAVLPRETGTAALEVTAKMIPATEVGGDYYDVLPVPGGCWIGIGDVAGHGLEAGLIMLQVQSAIKALVHKSSSCSPAEVLEHVNRVVFDNLHRSTSRALHMTLLLARYHDDGRVEMAGAHEDAIVYRAATGRCERLETRGTFIGLVRDITGHVEVTETRLSEDDILVLYTDGVTEAGAATGALFGAERLCATIEGVDHSSAERIRDAVLDSVSRWSPINDDDVTVVVARRRRQPPIALAISTREAQIANA